MPPIQLTVSQEKLLEKAWNCLMDENVGTLGLCGMGGVGKTTLLTQLKNKFLEAGDAFDLVIVVFVVPEEVQSIQDEISRKLCINFFKTGGSKREIASEINWDLKKLRFVLLLDDIQREEMDLEGIGVPLPNKENGCKIVFTTRSREPCAKKWIDAELEVPCLTPEEGWDLFQNIVEENTSKSHPEILKLARLVARNCGGFPLALNLIGRTMACRRTVREWQHVIDVFSSSTYEFSGTEDEILPILKFAYENLPGENIRSCLLYCALFPKNFEIRKGHLVDYWIGQGMIAEKEEDREIAEIHGYVMMDTLLRSGFLMENESGYGVRIHELVREMALKIATNFVVERGDRVHEMPMVKDWDMVKRMSLSSTLIDNISDPPDVSKLTTLFLQDNKKLKWISGDFFRWMTSLVVLDLSGNSKLSELSENVSCLVSLQLLNLSCTPITQLSIALKELKRLIHLDLDRTPKLKGTDVIPSLLKLQVLRLFYSVPVDLSLLQKIQCLQNLKELSLTVTEVAVLQQLLCIERLASCTRRLEILDSRISDGEISLVNVMCSLRELDIFIGRIPEISYIEKTQQFRHLRKVFILECTSLKDLTWLMFAPCIEDLNVKECFDMKQIISKEKAMSHESEQEQPFQSLTGFSLYDLPELESIYWTPLHFPVLEKLYIGGCPKLRRLPLNSESAKGNQVLRLFLEKEWIEGVEWEDEATKQRFSELNNRPYNWYSSEINR